MSFFNKTYADENHDKSALVGLCDVEFGGETFKNERIRLDFENGVICIEAAKFDSYRVPFGRPNNNELVVSNVSIHSRGVHLKAEKLIFSFIGSVGGGSLNVNNTDLSNVIGYHSRPPAISLICNTPVEFDVDSIAYERQFFTKFDCHHIPLTDGIHLNGGKYGFSIIGEDLFSTPNIDNAVAIIVGLRSAWASEWQGNKLRIRINAYKKAARESNTIISTGGFFRSFEDTSKNAQKLFPLALTWLNGLEGQQLTKALVAIDALLSARQYGVDYILGFFGVFRYWEWADNAKSLSRVPLAKCLKINKSESQALIDFRNDVIHGREFFHEAIKKCDSALREHSTRYIEDFDMVNPSASIMNYVHSISGESLIRIIGYDGDTQKYFSNSGKARVSNPLENISNKI